MSKSDKLTKLLTHAAGKMEEIEIPPPRPFDATVLLRGILGAEGEFHEMPSFFIYSVGSKRHFPGS